MITQTDKLSQINRKQRQKILQLKSRAENSFNRPSPSPFSSQKASPQISYNYSNTITIPTSSKGNTLDLLKEYQSNKTSSQENDQSLNQPGPGPAQMQGYQNNYNLNWSDKNGGKGNYLLPNGSKSGEKSYQYNSTLFKMLNKDQSHFDRNLDFANNGSSVSVNSNQTQNIMESNSILKDDSLLGKIDQLLKRNQNIRAKGGIKHVYDEYLQKRSMSNSSSAFSNNNSMSNSNDLSSSQLKLKSNTGMSYLNKLKTIQQQKATLTIDRQQAESQPQKKPIKKPTPNKKPPVATQLIKKPPMPRLASLTTIQRQKNKIKQTMQEIKKQQNQYVDKDSLVLELSDNQSQGDRQFNYDGEIGKQLIVGERNGGKQERGQQLRRQSLNQEKSKLTKQLEDIQKQLEQLEREQQNQQI